MVPLVFDGRAVQRFCMLWFPKKIKTEGKNWEKCSSNYNDEYDDSKYIADYSGTDKKNTQKAMNEKKIRKCLHEKWISQRTYTHIYPHICTNGEKHAVTVCIVSIEKAFTKMLDVPLQISQNDLHSLLFYNFFSLLYFLLFIFIKNSTFCHFLSVFFCTLIFFLLIQWNYDASIVNCFWAFVIWIWFFGILHKHREKREK